MIDKMRINVALGDLIAGLYDTFEAASGEPDVAAAATESTLVDLLQSGRATFARFARLSPPVAPPRGLRT